MKRRGFVDILLGIGAIGWIGSILYPLMSYLNPPEIAEANVNSVKVGKINDMPKNSSQIVKFGRKPVILIREENGNFVALSATCTHLDCTVQYRPDMKHIWCACHNGQYDLTGKNIAGPPPKPLKEYAVNVVNGEVIVSKA